ncbi:amino acid permease [Kingella negevensis]|uniref:amino acid permease n=1 Tax=Kingella negevensis TaxID=1522312 RepID=UPI00050A10B8|nr:amino acid permease [Kingella negevensis]MDK4687823.1 amino acid permease [Kingella negevensis]WII91182.1 amino acid permease [Kingella negevensis]WII92971.1 amino acid permease [Kingella negevensis]
MQNSPQQSEGLQRNLKNRHLQLIAIGGAIGTGLFMGSGKTISLAGPSVLLTYVLIGFFLFFVMRAMGELLLSNLEYKSFTDFTYDILGPGAGFFVGWTYWFCWVVIGIADIVAITGYVQFWWADVPLWLPGLVCILFMGLMNMLTVKSFGEMEFWFALVKILAIVGLVLAGLYLIFTGFVNPKTGVQASFTHLWSRPGGIFPHGIDGFFSAFQIAVFAFLGIELVGTAAAETQDPYKNLPAAINRIPVRIMIFYVLALTIIMTVTPWDEVNPKVSPFVNMFTLIGVPIAASLINLVVLSSAMSSANGGVFSTGRMLYGLAQNQAAPKIFGKLNINGVPAPALLFSCALLLAGLVLTYQEGDIMEVFTIVTTISSIGFIFVWSMILLAYIKYYKTQPEQHAKSTYKMPGGAVMAWVCLGFLFFALCLFSRDADTLKGMLYTPVWFTILAIAYLLKFKKK